MPKVGSPPVSSFSFDIPSDLPFASSPAGLSRVASPRQGIVRPASSRLSTRASTPIARHPFSLQGGVDYASDAGLDPEALGRAGQVVEQAFADRSYSRSSGYLPVVRRFSEDHGLLAADQRTVELRGEGRAGLEVVVGGSAVADGREELTSEPQQIERLKVLPLRSWSQNNRYFSAIASPNDLGFISVSDQSLEGPYRAFEWPSVALEAPASLLLRLHLQSGLNDIPLTRGPMATLPLLAQELYLSGQAREHYQPVAWQLHGSAAGSRVSGLHLDLRGTEIRGNPGQEPDGPMPLRRPVSKISLKHGLGIPLVREFTQRTERGVLAYSSPLEVGRAYEGLAAAGQAPTYLACELAVFRHWLLEAAQVSTGGVSAQMGPVIAGLLDCIRQLQEQGECTRVSLGAFNVLAVLAEAVVDGASGPAWAQAQGAGDPGPVVDLSARSPLAWVRSGLQVFLKNAAIADLQAAPPPSALEESVSEMFTDFMMGLAAVQCELNFNDQEFATVLGTTFERHYLLAGLRNLSCQALGLTHPAEMAQFERLLEHYRERAMSDAIATEASTSDAGDRQPVFDTAYLDHFDQIIAHHETRQIINPERAALLAPAFQALNRLLSVLESEASAALPVEPRMSRAGSSVMSRVVSSDWSVQPSEPGSPTQFPMSL